jgi:regulatory protein
MVSSCFEKACDLLAQRPHFRAELERKLGQRGHDQEAIAAALDRLGDLGSLDDAGCAHSLAIGPLSRRGYGPLRMRVELERRGAPVAEAAAAVAAAFVDGEEEAARRVAERWLSRRAASGKARASLARHLGRKGFSSGTVYRLVRELVSEGDN